MSNIAVCALYKFVRLDNFKDLQQPLQERMENHRVRGTLLLAHEGINGTIAGEQTSVDAVLAFLNNDERLNPLETKLSYHDELPFLRSKVKLKKEIVTMGVEGIDPAQSAGTYVAPEDWNALIQDPDVLVIDTRNDYECEIGTFENAVNPKTTSFREFPAYAKTHLETSQHKKVAMFCTGGIRCEKSTAYLKEQGFEDVYHLQGGILNYLKEVPETSSLWRGECFVFDERVAVNHSLEKGSYDQCHACRYPITQDDKLHPHYQQGVSCHRCFDSLSDAQKQRFAEREKQVSLAKKRGEQHIGGDVNAISNQRRQAKKAAREHDRKSN